MTDPQYLILHKVRGQPQFDIADKAMYGDEEGWSLCTCGHRAYPLHVQPLSNVIMDGEFHDKLKNMPPNWPEHYAQHPEPKLKLNVLELVSSMLPKLKRRL